MFRKTPEYLVTGGAGFIGSHIVDALVKRGNTVRVVDNLVAGSMDNLKESIDKIEFIKGDIRNERLMTQVIAGIEYVSHQAALKSVPKSMTNKAEFYDVNVRGTQVVLQVARIEEIKRMVFASSSSVYGGTGELPQKETAVPHPQSPYASTKLLGEINCITLNRDCGFPIICLRYFNVFGPRQPLDDQYSAVIPKFINLLYQGEALPIYGDGEQSRDFTYVSNVVQANLLALDASVKEGTYNVGCCQPRTVNELAKELYMIMKAKGGDKGYGKR